MHECVPYFKLPQRGCIPSSADGSTSAASAVPRAARMGGSARRRGQTRFLLSRIYIFFAHFPLPNPFPHSVWENLNRLKLVLMSKSDPFPRISIC